MNCIQVTSHVARDFLQNSDYFNTPAKVIWEYVSNSIDSAKSDVPLKVFVYIKKYEIIIADNARGMDKNDLKRFFQMHGENIARKKGKKVRGKFSTGKSAAFGIAKKLIINTTKNKYNNTVQITIDKIKEAREGDPIPVDIIRDNEKTDEADGTIIIIRDYKKKESIDITKIIAFIEKRLSRERIREKIYVNDYECKIKDQPFQKEYLFESPENIQPFIGKVQLVIRVSPFHLKDDERGIDILSHGNLQETTLAEISGDQVNRLFGHVDVPYLEEMEDEIPTFNNTRDSKLNRSNERVHKLLFWLGEEIKKVQRDLIKEEAEKKKDEQIKKLEKQAKELSKLLNEDFSEVMNELELSRQILGRKKNTTFSIANEDGQILPGQGEDISSFEEYGNEHGAGINSLGDVSSGKEKRTGPDLKEGESKGCNQQLEDKSKHKRRNRGLFQVEFEKATVDQHRSRYESETRTIFVNLDHPQIKIAYNESDNNINAKIFKMHAFEAAIVEYAQAVQYERMQSGELLETIDILFNIKDSIDRLTRKFVSLFE